MSDIQIHAAWAAPMAADIARARESITISALSMLPPLRAGITPIAQLWRALVAAATRGVRVDIYLPAPQRVHPATAHNGAAFTACAAAGMHTHVVKPPRLLHAKTCTIDNRVAWVGSGNWTAAAAHHNHEIYARFESVECVRRIREVLKEAA